MADDNSNKFQEPLDLSRVNIQEDAAWDERNDRLVEAILLSLGQPAPAKEQIHKILKEGVNLNARQANGQTALDIAKYHECSYYVIDILKHASEKGNASLAQTSSNPDSTDSPVEEYIIDSPVEIEFHGTAGGYFRVWIVNLCLTILTLGIYSAWAKVRKKQYFYSSTSVDGSTFEYLGQPIPILKGRIIAFVLVMALYLSVVFLKDIFIYILLFLFLIIPWIITQSAAFNSFNSAYRNIKFGFDGTYLDAFRAIYINGLIPIAVIGGIFLQQKNPEQNILGPIIGVLFLLFPFWYARTKRFMAKHTLYGSQRGHLEVGGFDYYLVYFISGFVAGGASLLLGVIFMAFSDSISQMQEDTTLSFIAAAPIYFGYFVAYAYIQARSLNLIWNNVSFGTFRFESIITATAFIKLYVVNAFAILISLGLLIPWAKIRVLKYRAENLRGLVNGDMGQYVSGESETVHATGAEIGEVFSVDMSL